MVKILLSPHNDDSVLFASFLILRDNPHVITILRSQKQEAYGIKYWQREKEDVEAMSVLGVTLFEQWPEPDVDPDWDAIRAMLLEIKAESSEPIEQVFAPAIEQDGHEQHNMVGQLAVEVFDGLVEHYTTYTRHRGRTIGEEILPEPWMISLKLQALSCYRTQMHPETGCQPWFLDGIREYIL